MIMKKTALIFIAFSLLVSRIYTQAVSADETAVPEEEIIQSTEKMEPVFSVENSSIIFVEGEDAVSTNFTREPILNYSCSGFRTLQLNQYTDLHGEATYNSDYVFYIEEDGVYELWYGGTPPGSRDEFITSYASPFRYVLDSLFTTNVYREDMHVVEEYSPSYYWNYVQDITLSAGNHRIKFEVLEKRNLDNKYFFYLDNFFFVKKVNDKRVVAGEIPEVFPVDMDNRTIDTTFQSFEEYEVLIRENPEVVENYIFLAKIYSLAGDYLNALKYLRRAAFLEPDDPDIMLLTAKNLIWRGATAEGLSLYSDLLEIVPERIDIWTEAGKIAGWTGQYQDSIDFFEGGLKILPDDLSLLANLGITNLWRGEVNDAEKQFEKIQNLSGDNLALNRELAEIFRINGYPDKAVPIYRHLINLYPEQLELYFDLEETYIEDNQRDKIPSIRKITEETFLVNRDYTKVTDTFYESQSMKEKVIEDYEEQLQNDPENLNLRRILAEIYFWNGYKNKAISEYRNILTNYTYLNLLKTEQDMTPFLELLDRSYALSHFMKNVPSNVERESKKLSDLLKQYNSAKTSLATLKKKNDGAQAKGKTVDRTDESAIEDQIFQLEEELATAIYLMESFIEKFNSLSTQFDEEKDNLKKLLEDELVSTEAFAQLMEGINWKWDRYEMFQELDSVKKDKVILGSYVMGKISQFEGNLSRAYINLAPMVKETYVLPRAPFALYETNIWRGANDKNRELYEQFSSEINDSVDYIYYLNDYLDFLYLEEDNPFGYLTEDPEESINDIKKSLETLKALSIQISDDLAVNISEIHNVLVTNMERGFYTLASETYLLRNELGDFYYNEKDYIQAISQYKQVLSVDPWNLSAKFKLAQVYDVNGDWSRALEIYGDIYEQDSQFNNVAAFYNDINRDHADSFNFSAKSFSDTSSLIFNGHGDYNVLFNRNWGLSLDYDIEHNRKYRAYNDGEHPDSAVHTDDTAPSTILVNSLTAAVPISVSKLTITPVTGFHLKTDLVDGDGRNNDTGNLDITSNPTFGLLDYGDIYIFAGADLMLNLATLTLSGGYRFDWEEDSFHPGNSAVYYHKANLAMGLNGQQSNIPFIEDSSLFLSGYINFLEDGNKSWFASAVASNSIQLHREPAMYLNWSLDFSLEDAVEASPDYWTPEMSLLTGLNLDYTAVFGVGENRSLVEKVWFNTDFYSNGADNAIGLSFEAGNRLSYVKRDLTTFLNVTGSFTTQLDPSMTGINYWSLIIEFGVSVLLPDLLTP